MLKIKEGAIPVWLDEKLKGWEARCELDGGNHISATGTTQKEALNKLQTVIMMEHNDFQTEVVLQVIGECRFAWCDVSVSSISPNSVPVYSWNPERGTIVIGTSESLAVTFPQKVSNDGT